MEMTKRLLSMVALTALTVSFAACGSSDKSPTVTPTPTPPTRAQITFRLDPPLVVANYEGDGWYGYRVNLEFVETAGVAFTVATIRTVVTTAGGSTKLDQTTAVNRAVPAGNPGRWVTQWYVRYNLGGSRQALVTQFTATFTDAFGNVLTATTQVNVSHHGEPQRP
jgi:hypothetical protein